MKFIHLTDTHVIGEGLLYGQNPAERLRAGAEYGPLERAMRAELSELGFGEVEYIDLRCADTLAALPRADRPARLFVAAWLDGVRLIDNIPV